MNNRQRNFHSDFLFILLLLVSIICLDEQLVVRTSLQWTVAVVYLVGTTNHRGLVCIFFCQFKQLLKHSRLTSK